MPITYDLGSNGLTIVSDISMFGPGRGLTKFTYSGSGAAIYGKTVVRSAIGGFTVECSGSATAGVHMQGLQYSRLADIAVSGVSGSAGFRFDANEDTPSSSDYGGVYYNVLERLVAGTGVSSSNSIGFHLETTDLATTNLRRINNNVMISCVAQHNTSHGLAAIGCNTLQLISCNAEQNRTGNTGFGFKFQDCTDTYINGGYFEGNPQGHISLVNNLVAVPMVRTCVVRAFLHQTNPTDPTIVGNAENATGNYFVGTGAIPGLKTGTIYSGDIRFDQSATAKDVIFARRSGDTKERFTIDNDGTMLWGSGSADRDTRLLWSGPNVLTMAAGDSFRVDGTWDGGTLRLGANYVWVDTSGRLRIKSGAPTSATDGTVVGTQS